MAISFRPMSFHCSSTACDGLGAGFGGSFFAASCAITGIIANPIPNTKPANLFYFVMVFLLSFARKPDVLSFRRMTRPCVSSNPGHGTCPSELFILHSKGACFMQTPTLGHVKLVFEI